MRHYVTICRDYQLAPLYESMRRHCQPFVLHVLGWDFDAPLLLSDDRAHVWGRSRDRFLRSHPGLARLPGPPRNPNETVCSVRWRFALDIMQTVREPVTVIDGDVWFFSSPEPYFAEIEHADYALSPHRFPAAAQGLPGATMESHRQFGLYNGGWSTWARPEPMATMATLCESWSYQGFHDYAGQRLFGDQGWLEVLLGIYPSGHVIQHPGVNLAPWNVQAMREIHVPESGPPTMIVPGFATRQPLIAYHYQSLRWDAAAKKATQLADPSYELDPKVAELLYRPYLDALGRATLHP